MPSVRLERKSAAIRIGADSCLSDARSVVMTSSSPLL
jgi:hypothetical protein